MTARVLSRLSLAGLCATLVGNGIGRFAFVALMPALITAGWFTKAEASTLGVATLVGYVLGAAVANPLAARVPGAWLLRAAMLACALSFLCCAFDGAGLAWVAAWRAAAGFGGAILMVLPASMVLPRQEASVRARVSGVVFSGIGVGAALSGFLVPLLVALRGDSPGHGVAMAWLGMGLLCLVLTALAWSAWPDEALAARREAAASPLPRELRATVALLVLAHGLNAIGYLAHTLFLPDYVVRELGHPLSQGGFYWSMFGLGAALGPMVAGALADAFGLRRCLLAGLLLKAASAILPVASTSAAALLASSLLMGLCTPGVVTIVSAYALQRVGAEHHARAWGLATAGFALAQASGGAAMAFAATRLDSYQPLFCASALALVGATACIVLIRDHAGAMDSSESPEPEVISDPSLEHAVVAAPHP